MLLCPVTLEFAKGLYREQNRKNTVRAKQIRFIRRVGEEAPVTPTELAWQLFHVDSAFDDFLQSDLDVWDVETGELHW